MITGKHIKAARAVLGIGSQELADMAGVSINTVLHFERGGTAYGTTIGKMQVALEERGIEFLGTGKPGIRWGG